jgi:hypothetical protein
MQKYIVIPVMITGKASKTYKAGDIVDSDMLATNVDELVENGYIKAINTTPAPVAISEMPQKFDVTPTYTKKTKK